MKKSTIALIITLMTLICASASAQPSRAGTLQSLAAQDIDLSKLITDASNIHDVSVTFGRHTFKGKITNSDLQLSEREVYDIVHRVMDRMNLAPGFFSRVKHDQAEWARTGGPMDWTPIIQDCLTMGGLIPGAAGTVSSMAADVIGVQQGSTSANEGLMNVASTASMSILEDLGSGSVLAAGAHSALGGFGQASGIYSALMASSHLSDYLIEHHVMDGIFDWDPLSKLLEDELKIFDFYLTSNVEILKLLEKRSTMSGWKLEISGTDTDAAKRLIGVSSAQTWTLECKMEAVARLTSGKKDPRDYQGTYQGLFKLVIENDMKTFDEEFKNGVFLNKGLPFASWKAIFEPEDQILSPSGLKKTINIPNFTIDIKSSDGTYSGGHEANFNMDFLLSAADTYFSVNHVVEMLLDDGFVWNNGVVTLAHASGKGNFSMKTNTSSSNHGLEVSVIFSSKQVIEYIQLPVSHHDYSAAMNAATPGGTDLAVTDRGVFSDLRGNGTIKVEPLKKAVNPVAKSVGNSSTATLARNAVPKAVEEKDDILWPEWTLDKDFEKYLGSISTEVPAKYSWLLPEGGSSKTTIRVMEKEITIVIKNGSDEEYNRFVSRLKSHGFTEPVSDGVQSGMKMWEARTADGKKQCAVMQNKDKISVSIENTDPIPTPDNHKKNKEDEFEKLMQEYLKL